MSDQSPFDLSDFQLGPDWLKENPKQKNYSTKENFREPNNKREGKRKKWNKDKGNAPRRQRNYKDRNERIDPPGGIQGKIIPAKGSLKQIADQIKKTAISYSVFEIAKSILSQRERYQISFTCNEEADNKLYFCSQDESLWLSKKEAENHLLKKDILLDYYNKESVEVDAPKGNFQSVGVCGLSGTLIAPPNHHSYQKEIIKLHKSRFPEMQLEKFKSKIRIESSEEEIEKWKKQQSIQDQKQ